MSVVEILLETLEYAALLGFLAAGLLILHLL